MLALESYVLARIDNGYRICVLGDLNGWGGGKMRRVGITSAYGAPR